MKLLALVLSAATLAVAQLPPPASKPAQKTERANALPDANTILQRAAAATGGTEAYKSIKTQKLAGRITLPETGISGTVVTYRSQRGEMYQVVEMPGAGKIEAGNNGDVEWERSTLTGPKIRRVASKPGNLLEPDPTAVAAADSFSKIETAGLDQVNGKPCFLVHQWPNSGSGAMQTACYDRETYLPVRLEMNAGAASIKLTLGDYRPAGPVKLPFLVETETKGQTIRMEIDTITLNEPLPQEAVELPDEIEKLAYHQPVEIRDLEVDKDRPTLRHRTKQ